MDKKQPSSSGKGSSGKSSEPRAPLSPAAKGFLIAIVAVLVLSVVARAVLGQGSGEPAGGADAQAQSSFLPGQPTPAGGEETSAAAPGGVEKALPYITEGSFFALLGFALGYASKKFLKIGLIVLAVFFVGIQGLSFAGVVTVDWGRAVAVMDSLVLNLKENETFTQVLTDRLPSAGAFLAAWFVGFKSG